MATFNVVTALIVFREAVEGVVVVSVLLQFLTRSLSDASQALHRLRTQVWAGAALGLAAAAACGLAIVFSVLVLKTSLVSGVAANLVQCAFQVLAIALQTYLAVKLLTAAYRTTSSQPVNGTTTRGMAARWESRLASQLASAIQSSNNGDQFQRPRRGLLSSLTSEMFFALTAFTVVFREGLESFVYVCGISASADSLLDVVFPAAAGLAAAIALGVVVHHSSKNINLATMMRVSIALMLILSAAMVSEVVAELDEMINEEVLGGEDDEPFTPVLWDARWCCSESRGGPLFFQILGSVVGYRARPTLASLLAYITYWVGVWGWVSGSRWRSQRRKALTPIIDYDDDDLEDDVNIFADDDFDHIGDDGDDGPDSPGSDIHLLARHPLLSPRNDEDDDY